MAGAGPTFSQAELKLKIDSVSKDIYFIDLELQKIRQSGGNSGDRVQNLQAAKLDLQKQVVQLQVQLELKKAQSRKQRKH